MKRKFGTFMALALSLSIIACSSNTASTSTSAPSTGSASSNENGKQVTLKIGLPSGFDVTKEEIIRGFEKKYPNIKLNIDQSPWAEFTNKIPTQIAGGTAPDIWFQENAVILGYGERGVAEDLTPYLKKDINSSDFIDGLNVARSSDGAKIWGIPHGINPVALGYNKKMFQDANLPLPTDNWTYQDMIDAAKKLGKDTNGDGKKDVYGFISAYEITQGWFPWIKSTGGQILDPTHKKAVMDAKAVEGITKWQNMNKEGISAPRAYTQAIGKEWQVFGKEVGAMYFVQYNLQVLLKRDFPNLDWDVVKMPVGFDGKRVVPMISNSWLIYSKAKPEAKEAAWTFMKYWLSEESQDILAASGTSLPIRKSSLEKVPQLVKNISNVKAFTDGIAESGMTMDESPEWMEWYGAVKPIFFDLYDGKLEPQAGADAVREKIQGILNKSK